MKKRSGRNWRHSWGIFGFLFHYVYLYYEEKAPLSLWTHLCLWSCSIFNYFSSISHTIEGSKLKNYLLRRNALVFPKNKLLQHKMLTQILQYKLLAIVPMHKLFYFVLFNNNLLLPAILHFFIFLWWW